MSNVVVSLGGVPFQDFEVPEKIAFGGAQRVVVQQLIGGGRVVNVLGADDREIAFAGIFAGDDAAGRAQAVDATRVAGAAVPLVWGEYFFSVVVAEFAADYAKPWWIPFSLRCVVVDDAGAPAVARAGTLVGGDIAAAAALSSLAGYAVTGLAAPTAAGLAAAQGAIAAGIGAAGGALSAASLAVGGAADAPAGLAAVNQVVAASGMLAGLSGMSGYINRAAANFGGTLF